MDTNTLIVGWVQASDESSRHFYRIEPGQVADKSLCGRGLSYGREWVARHGSDNHAHPFNCKFCERKRSKIQCNG